MTEPDTSELAPLSDAIESLEKAEYGLSGITWQNQAEKSLQHVGDALQLLREERRDLRTTYDNPLSHLCTHCGLSFEVGDEIVSLADGTIWPDEKYDIDNIRLFHRDCWFKSDYSGPGGSV